MVGQSADPAFVGGAHGALGSGQQASQQARQCAGWGWTGRQPSAHSLTQLSHKPCCPSRPEPCLQHTTFFSGTYLQGSAATRRQHSLLGEEGHVLPQHRGALALVKPLLHQRCCWHPGKSIGAVSGAPYFSVCPVRSCSTQTSDLQKSDTAITVMTGSGR